MKSSLSFAKVSFVLSLAVLSFGYGFASHALGLFPKTYVERAWQQFYALTLERGGTNVFIGTPRYARQGVMAVWPEEVQPGLTLLSSAWKGPNGWAPELRLVDRNGEVLHRWRVDREALFQKGFTPRGTASKADVNGAHLLEGGDVVINLEYRGMARLDACGRIQWALAEGNHHSIARAEDGSFWVPGVSQTPRSKTERFPNGFPGLKGKKIWVDRILHVSQEGRILGDIDVLTVIYENGLERYIPKVLGGPLPTPQSLDTDITHLNDVEPLPSSMADEYPLFQAGDLLVSLRSLSLVFVFDPETMTVKWHSSDPFIYQHDPDFIGDGWIGVFDNNYDFIGGQMLGGSRIVALQPHTDSVEVRFPTPSSDPIYTETQGRWQQLANGNMLLTESMPGRVVEVNPSGETVWEWVHRPISTSKIPRVTKASRHDLTREEVASWPCSLVDSGGTSPQKQQTAP